MHGSFLRWTDKIGRDAGEMQVGDLGLGLGAMITQSGVAIHKTAEEVYLIALRHGGFRD